MKLKIGILVGSLTGGGAEKVAANLSIYLYNNGFDVYIFSGNDNNKKTYEFQGYYVPIPKCYGLKKDFKEKEQWEAAFLNSKKVKSLKHKYQINVTISFSNYYNLLNILSKDKDKIILTVHNIASIRKEFYDKIYFKRKTFRFLYPYADAVVAVSEFCKSDLVEKMHIPSRSIRVIYNPVNNSQLGSSFHEENETKDNKIILFVGRLEKVKQPWHLICSFSAVLEKHQDALLVILGQGELVDELQSMVMEANIQDNVIFMGFVENVIEYMKKATLLIVTSSSEACPCVVAEALACGLPVISNDCPGGVGELLGKDKNVREIQRLTLVKCGILTPCLEGTKHKINEELTYAEKELSNAMDLLLTSPLIRDNLSQECLKESSKYCMTKIGDEWKDLVKNIITFKFTIIQKLYKILFFVIDQFLELKKKNYDEIESKADKYLKYMNVFDCWMQVKEKEKSICDYLLRHDMKNIAIYGLGNLGYHLYEELKNSKIKITYGIDKYKKIFNENLNIISPDDQIPDADVIIVTAVYDFVDIRQKLSIKTKIPVVGLDSILYELRDEQS